MLKSANKEKHLAKLFFPITGAAIGGAAASVPRMAEISGEMYKDRRNVARRGAGLLAGIAASAAAPFPAGFLAERAAKAGLPMNSVFGLASGLGSGLAFPLAYSAVSGEKLDKRRTAVTGAIGALLGYLLWRR